MKNISEIIQEFDRHFDNSFNEYYCCDGIDCACGGIKMSKELKYFIRTAITEIVESVPTEKIESLRDVDDEENEQGRNWQWKRIGYNQHSDEVEKWKESVKQ